MSHAFVKAPHEVAKIKVACRVVATILEEVSVLVRPGTRTGDLEEAAREAMRRLGAKPSFLGYSPQGKPPYPAVICVSVDDEVVHGIPGRCAHLGRRVPDRTLREGSLVSLDCGVQVDGWHGDSAVTVPVGTVSLEKTALSEACRAALWAGIRAVRPGATLSALAEAISGAARVRGPYGIVAGYGGHGIGRSLHEAPFVPNLPGSHDDDCKLREGFVLALEPMLNLGGAATYERGDGWTVATQDGSPSAHFEHTVAVTRDGYEVLTLRTGESPA